MTQERLATELVHKHGLKEGRTKSVPMSTSIKLVQAAEDQLLDREEYHYSELVGSLLYSCRQKSAYSNGTASAETLE